MDLRNPKKKLAFAEDFASETWQLRRSSIAKCYVKRISPKMLEKRHPHGLDEAACLRSKIAFLAFKAFRAF
jgi:hypothetical protein